MDPWLRYGIAEGSLINLLKHPRRHQLLLDMPLDALSQELAQVGAALARPGRSAKIFKRSAEHLRRHRARFCRHLRAGQPLVAGTEQAIGQSMKERAAAVQSCPARNAMTQVRQQADQANDP